MKKYFILLLLAFFQFSCLKYTGDMVEINETIQEVGKEFAPDKRVAIFDIDQKVVRGKLVLSGVTNIPEAKEKLINKIKESGNEELVDSILVLPTPTLGEEVYGIVRLAVCNIRSERKNSAELSTQSLMGTPVRVWQKEGYWTRIQTPDDYIGWTDGDAYEPVTKQVYDAWIAAPKVMVTSIYTFCYEGASSGSAKVTNLAAGNLLKFEEDAGRYYKVSLPDGRTGYVSKADSDRYADWKESREFTAEKIISTAKELMGIPYLWGGTSPWAADCSGFTKTVYFLNGIILPRDASQQVFTGELIGETVDFEKLQPGDLLFFGRKASAERGERITHVGIYIGDTEFIHASGLVKINSLDETRENYSAYRHKSFVRAKRILDAPGEHGSVLVSASQYYK